ncbi:MAG: class I SAM-dependent methyltransferase [Halobacteriota archaeon]
MIGGTRASEQLSKYKLCYDGMELLENERELVQKLCVRIIEEEEEARKRKPNIRLKILDIGCGTGKLALHLSEVTDGEVTAIDPIRKSIAQAKEKAPSDTVAFEVQSAESLNFADDSFDVVVSLKALHEMGNPAVALREARRVLKTTGKIFIIDWIGIGGVARTGSHRHAKKYFTMKRLEEMLSEAGFRGIIIEEDIEFALMLVEGDKEK